MNAFVELSKLDYLQPFSGLKAKVVHSDTQTVAFWEIDEGTLLPEHKHPHKQISIVTEGTLELTVDEETRVLGPGMVVTIREDTLHSARALTNVKVTDIFHPIREDLKLSSGKISIVNTEPKDLDFSCQLYHEAIKYQRKNGYPEYRWDDRDMQKKYIEAGIHYKVVIGGEIACVFNIHLEDPTIWRELDIGESIYVHGVLINPLYKGRRIFGEILRWLINRAKTTGKKNIRLDTWAENPTLHNYYKSFGFEIVESFQIPNCEETPLNCRGNKVVLMEYTI